MKKKVGQTYSCLMIVDINYLFVDISVLILSFTKTFLQCALIYRETHIAGISVSSRRKRGVQGHFSSPITWRHLWSHMTSHICLMWLEINVNWYYCVFWLTLIGNTLFDLLESKINKLFSCLNLIIQLNFSNLLYYIY